MRWTRSLFSKDQDQWHPVRPGLQKNGDPLCNQQSDHMRNWEGRPEWVGHWCLQEFLRVPFSCDQSGDLWGPRLLQPLLDDPKVSGTWWGECWGGQGCLIIWHLHIILTSICSCCLDLLIVCAWKLLLPSSLSQAQLVDFKRRCTQTWTSWRRRNWALSAQSLFRLSGMWTSLRRGRAWRWSRWSGTRNRRWNRWGSRHPSDGVINVHERMIQKGWALSRPSFASRPAPVSAIFSTQRVKVNRAQWSLRLTVIYQWVLDALIWSSQSLPGASSPYTWSSTPSWTPLRRPDTARALYTIASCVYSPFSDGPFNFAGNFDRKWGFAFPLQLILILTYFYVYEREREMRERDIYIYNYMYIW